MNDAKAWWMGFALIVVFVFIGELTLAFKEYVFYRLGLNRDLILSAFWLLPVVASFLVVYLSKKGRTFKGLSLIPVLSVLGPLAHFLAGHLGATIDLAGLPGIKVTFPIYLVLSVITIGLGTILGALIKQRRD